MAQNARGDHSSKDDNKDKGKGTGNQDKLRPADKARGEKMRGIWRSSRDRRN